MITWTMTVDPGLDGTGWSIWADDENNRKDITKNPWRLLNSGAFTPRGTSLQERVANLSHVVRHTLVTARAGAGTKISSITVAVEHPQFFARAGATNASGSLVSLAMAAGAALCATVGVPDAHPLLVPLQWKGNLPKELCCKRILERMRRDPRYKFYQPKTKTTHEIDAIGISLHLQGRF